MTEYDAVVYDLDGTLVRLEVDWDVATADVRDVYAEAGLDAAESSLWELLEAAAEAGLRESVEAVIATHEREGAREARRLPHADELRERTIPTGVCSLNCEAACRIALANHDLLESVEAVVGRDSVSNHKPHPEPLLEVVERLEADPGRTLFVGDSIRDEETARRAGTDFEYVGDGPSGH
ncbi:HAD family hydrolase [Natrialbaceae archaeon AArc-T1-2]|uniref:HAD family hydrolase n=1 Tax=Natrialbaceae archaeon AArc-T1-2 TaxID=3053904 RepID=UPI00255B1126|nr:HAD family hydrolase [Natrialbaceae archaeon AArc-T1-2]WIV66024.1 HAD family hydrolase [Natrialbaceae archaeon AArc-T1-2]